MCTRTLRQAIVVLIAGVVVFFASIRTAGAVPSFSRKYETSCLTCHTVFPVLNPFGEAFRRNGYRMPTKGGNTDADAIKADQIALGQDEYKEMFPGAVWPDKLTTSVPLSMMINGAVAFNVPGHDAETAAGNNFAWNGVVGEAHIFAAGAFNDSLTYFGQITLSSDGVDIETAYLLWNDILGLPPHLVNVWVGRLMSASLTSWGMHSSYMSDTNMPAVSIAGLYNPDASFVLGPNPHTDGIEINGIVGHRVDYSVGYVGSSVVGNLKAPNAQDLYAHLGFKIGGIALDGEDSYVPADPMKPWAETSITLDAFAYRGLTLFDNGTAVPNGTPVGQRDKFWAAGGQLRAYLGSLQFTAGGQIEHHSRPYVGLPGNPGDPTTTPPTPATPGVPDLNDSTSFVQYDELAYVVYPWFVPAVRTEFTQVNMNSPNAPVPNGKANIMKIVFGGAFLVRPNIRVVLAADIEKAKGIPPAGSWGAAGAFIQPNPDQSSTLQAEQVTATFNVAF